MSNTGRDGVAGMMEGGLAGRSRRIALNLVRESLADDLLGLAAELAYRWLLAIFPLFITIAAIAGIVATGLNVEDPTDRLLEAAGTSLPPEAASTLRPQLERVLDNRDGGLLSLGLLLTIYAASSGMKAVIKGLNRAYDVEETRPLWRQALTALGLTVLLGTAVVLSFIAMVSGQVAAQEIARSVGLEESGAWLIEVAPYPFAIVALGIASGFLYWAAPARRLAWRSVVPGVVVFVPGSIIVTVAFSIYVSDFGSYADTYGALGGVIVLLLWFYLSALVLLLGGEVNAVLEREFDPDAERGRVPSRAVGEPLARPDRSARDG